MLSPGACVVGVVSKPFLFEGTRKAAAAERALKAVMQAASLVVVVDQQRLLQAADGFTVQQAYAAADRALTAAVGSLAEMALAPLVCRGEELRPADGLEVLRAPTGAAATLFGSGEAVCRSDSTLAAVAAAVSGAIFQAAGCAFLGGALLRGSRRVVCVLGGIPPGSEQGALEAGAQALATLAGGGSTTVVALRRPTAAAASAGVTAHLFVTSPVAAEPPAATTPPASPAAERPAVADVVAKRRDALSALASGSARSAMQPGVAAATAAPSPPSPPHGAGWRMWAGVGRPAAPPPPPLQHPSPPRAEGQPRGAAERLPREAWDDIWGDDLPDEEPAAARQSVRHEPRIVYSPPLAAAQSRLVEERPVVCTVQSEDQVAAGR